MNQGVKRLHPCSMMIFLLLHFAVFKSTQERGCHGRYKHDGCACILPEVRHPCRQAIASVAFRRGRVSWQLPLVWWMRPFRILVLWSLFLLHSRQWLWSIRTGCDRLSTEV